MTFTNPLTRVPMLGWSAMAMVVALGGYTLSARVAGERIAVEQLRIHVGEQADAIRAVHAELRVRMRMPQLERWNTETLALQPVAARQFVGDTGALVRLVAGGHGVEAEAPPQVVHAITAPPPAPPMLRQASYAPLPAVSDNDPDTPAIDSDEPKPEAPAARPKVSTSPSAAFSGKIAHPVKIVNNPAKSGTHAKPAKPKPTPVIADAKPKAHKPKLTQTASLDMRLDHIVAAAASAERKHGVAHP